MTTFVIVLASVIGYILLAVLTARPIYTLRYDEVTRRGWGPFGVRDPLPKGSQRAHQEARNYALGRAAIWPLTWIVVGLMFGVCLVCIVGEKVWTHLHVLRNIVTVTMRFITGGVTKVEAAQAAAQERIDAQRRAAEDYEDNKRIVAGWTPPPGWNP